MTKEQEDALMDDIAAQPSEGYAARETCKAGDGQLQPLGYAAWRAAAVKTLIELRHRKSEAVNEVRRLQLEIDGLEQVMANGASGGTAWQRQ